MFSIDILSCLSDPKTNFETTNAHFHDYYDKADKSKQLLQSLFFYLTKNKYMIAEKF